MSLSNYPAGVSGNEYEIVGPDDVRDEIRCCETCAYEGTVTVTYFRRESWWDCPECGETQDEYTGEWEGWE